jgi:hypothetical protein
MKIASTVLLLVILVLGNLNAQVKPDPKHLIDEAERLRDQHPAYAYTGKLETFYRADRRRHLPEVTRYLFWNSPQGQHYTKTNLEHGVSDFVGLKRIITPEHNYLVSPAGSFAANYRREGAYVKGRNPTEDMVVSYIGMPTWHEKSTYRLAGETETEWIIEETPSPEEIKKLSLLLIKVKGIAFDRDFLNQPDIGLVRIHISKKHGMVTRHEIYGINGRLWQRNTQSDYDLQVQASEEDFKLPKNCELINQPTVEELIRKDKQKRI